MAISMHLHQVVSLGLSDGKINTIFVFMRYSFSACRVSDTSNVVFPGQIIIDDEEEVLIYRKSRVIGCKESRVRFGAIGSVSISKGLLFVDIFIETKGGREIVAQGFTRSDAKEIVNLIG